MVMLQHQLGHRHQAKPLPYPRDNSSLRRLLVVVYRQKEAEQSEQSLQTWLVLEMLEHQQGRILPHMDE